MNKLNFSEHDARVHADALRAFRLRKRTKKALSTAPVIAAAMLVTLSGLYRTPTVTGPNHIEANVPVSVESPNQAHLLNDEQLINMFPAGSCFLAEVNGRKILVFNEP